MNEGASQAARGSAGHTAPGYNLRQRALAEALGTAMLLCAVIGSGIMAQRLSAGNNAIALLANTLATVWALFVLIELLGPISGAHFNPLVSLAFLPRQPQSGSGRAKEVAVYALAQALGAVAGAWLANAMFGLPVWQTSTQLRGGWGQWLAEAVATAGLVVVIAGSARAGVQAKASALVASYIGAAYWFTASTSFANPAAVLGRTLSDSFAGIAPASAIGFVAAQFVGALLGLGLAKLLGEPVEG